MEGFNLFMSIVGPLSLAISIYINYKTLKRKRLIDKLKKGPKVVVIGGGTGQSIFLRGLKKFTDNITAVVTVADDGGGSGILREDLGMLPPGDIRNCILALADMEPTMEKVMQYRFTEGQLKGQSFGNLFLAAMNGIYGNFEIAVSKISEIFAITGNVFPITVEDVNLVAQLKNGNLIKGESIIPNEVKKQKSKIDKVFLEPENPKPLKEVINAISEADIIVIGPGSLYTSIIPNLMVEGIVDSILSTNAIKVYISNIMTQPGETDDYNVYDHVKSIINHTKDGIIDVVIANNENISKEDLEKYKQDGSKQVFIDSKQEKKINSLGIKIMESNLAQVKKTYIRHDAEKISKIIIELSLNKKLRSII